MAASAIPMTLALLALFLIVLGVGLVRRNRFVRGLIADAQRLWFRRR